VTPIPNTQTAPRALLAEDDTLIRELVTGYLEQLGFHVEGASNGKIALNLLKSGQPRYFDLIVTDLLMPQVSGETLIELARENHSCERFLIMSGNPASSAPESMTRREDAAFLEKPFTFRDFEAKVSSLRTRSCA